MRLRRTPAGAARSLRHAQGDEHAVAGRDDRGGEALVVRDHAVVLEDRVRGLRVPPVVARRVGDRAGPQHVVAEVEAADADAFAGSSPRVRVPFLVDVVVDDVEPPVDVAEIRDRIAHVPADRFGQARPREVVERLGLVRRIAVRPVHLAARSYGSREPVGRVPEPRPELEHPTGAHRTREQLDRHAHEPADDREPAFLALGLHLEQHGLVVAREQRAHVILDARVDDVHGPDATGYPGSAMSDVGSRSTDSGIDLEPVYEPDDLGGFDPDRDLGPPGGPPFTRGVYPSMYLGHLWTMRQYAGMATADETNRRFRYLLDHGQTGLSVAFDLPTQMGYDSDHPRAEGGGGKTGVAIDSVEDVKRLLDGIPLDGVSTSMTINATAGVLLLMYELVAEERGLDSRQLSGTVQNDILKEYAARGTYIYPPKPSMRLITDLFAYCHDRIPKWNTISISGYHMREAGATAVQELAFTVANAIAYVEAAPQAGLAVDAFAPRVSFFFACHMNFFEEVAKFRAARRMWARIMPDRFDSADPRSAMLRFHTQTGGATLTAQQPENNIVRTTMEALAAVLGGTQSLHTNSFDEAMALPTESAVKIALRTQQILGHESGVPNTIDPVAGSYFVEALTNEIEERAEEYVDKVEGMGGAVAAIEAGFYQDEIHEAAFRIQLGIESGERVLVGVNRFQETAEPSVELQQIAPGELERQVDRVRELRADRDGAEVERWLGAVEDAARGTDNLLYPMKEALRARATLGEVSDALRRAFGEYHPK